MWKGRWGELLVAVGRVRDQDQTEPALALFSFGIKQLPDISVAPGLRLPLRPVDIVSLSSLSQSTRALFQLRFAVSVQQGCVGETVALAYLTAVPFESSRPRSCRGRR